MAEPQTAQVTLDGFATALRSPPVETAPAGVANPHGGPAVKRFGVYRNNIAVGLKAALADIFPVTRDLVGANFFAAMAAEYISREPPRSPVLAEYGHGFAGFIAGFAPAQELFFLADVARLERAWLDAYHALDVTPLSPEALQRCSPEALMALTLKPHPAARLLRFDSAAASIFTRVRDGSGLEGFDPTPAEVALISRPYFDVTVMTLAPGKAAFFEALMSGGTIGEAVGAGTETDPQFDPADAFSAMIGTGAFAAAASTEE
ncbi:DNA-binding domain-containing protein [uncultured Martelella sp.]|uniref:DNA-binding domain-containing protein n=1 Tax=uncultured Martelella sp. TaxID=392331 RepID=UPI0029C96CCF|nr:DNA-binding domain-containing protein [uncultured Martelella sp.]